MTTVKNGKVSVKLVNAKTYNFCVDGTEHLLFKKNKQVTVNSNVANHLLGLTQKFYDRDADQRFTKNLFEKVGE